MDKFEYKIKADEIKELIAQKEYEQAAEIADTIDWRRVKSVMMLCTISDLYKMCHRYEDSRDMLLLAYERHPGGRTIVYSLCELSIKMEEFLQAVEYYKEFIQIAPKDTGKYILQYKLYEAQDVSLEERIAVLEELKKKDYREKWAYELAYLYHRVGLAAKCVEECDELELWFGNGKYVIKALELKMLHAPLTDEQQYKYDHRFGEVPEADSAVHEVADHEKDPEKNAEKDPQDDVPGDSVSIPAEEVDIQVKTLDVGKYDTINLQEELAAGIQEYFDTAKEEEITRSIMEPMLNMDTTDIVLEEMKAEAERKAENPEEKEEIFFGETGEIHNEKEISERLPVDSIGEIQIQQPPKNMENVLSMEADGQISFVLPQSDPIEKQITGQISIDDIILEWERRKKENEEKRREEVRQRVLQQTGSIFINFETAAKSGLLEELEGSSEKEKSLAEIFGDKQDEPIPEDIDEGVEQPGTANETDETVFEISEIEAESTGSEETEITADVTVMEEAEEPADVTAMEEAEEPADETAIEEAEEPADEAASEEAEEPANETASEEAEEPADETASEEAEEPADETAMEEVESPVKEAVREDGYTSGTELVQQRQKSRNLTREEKELYGQFIQGRSSKEQLIKAVDGISMAAYTGNVIVTGDEGMNSIDLAKNMIREVQMTDSNFSGKTAKISGSSLNTRDVKQIISNLDNGALIIQKASGMNKETVDRLYNALQQEHIGIIVVMEDTKRMMDRFLERNEKLLQCFTSRVDVAALSDDALVSFAKKYAREKEYSIDEFGILALHTRIAQMQTSDHAVTMLEVKEIMDEAMASANRKTIGHFFDILLAKRYDEEDMIILKEKDFI